MPPGPVESVKEFGEGGAVVTLNTGGFDFYIDHYPDSGCEPLKAAIDHIEALGYVALDPVSECEYEEQEDGAVRIFLTPKEPVEGWL